MYQKKVKLLFGLIVVLSLLISFSSTSSAQQSEVKPPLKIVQLGDSYSAGNGARSESGEKNYVGIEGCYRSPTNWGSQFAETLKDKYNVTYINRACSGARIKDITEPRDIEDYIPDLQIDGCNELEYPNEEYYDPDNHLFCDRLLKPQIEAIDSSVDLVIMTMGGNDIEFAKIVQDCFAIGFRDPALCKFDVDSANINLSNVRDDLLRAFRELRAPGRLRPTAKIVFVPYPYLLTDVNYWLMNTNNFPLPIIYNAGSAIRTLGDEGDKKQKEAVDVANLEAGNDFIVWFPHTKTLFAGHEPNPSVLFRNPDRWIHEFETFTVLEWYHPNSLGHENWAAALAPYEAFGVTPAIFGKNADLDVAFVVDTTGSMDNEIAQVRADLSNLVNQLDSTTDSYRVALVSYRDFPERTGYDLDYPAEVIQTFTDDPDLIQAAIDSLTLGYGGDEPETVFSGIQAANELSWRAGVTKIAIVIGDAPPLSPEPNTNYTAPQIVDKSIAVDPVKVVGVDTGRLNGNGMMGVIAEGTGGSVILGTSGLTAEISEILDSAVKQPFAWVGEAYSAKIGEPVQFSATGSYDPSGSPLTLYEWDFNSDGMFDLQTQEPMATHIYDEAFDDYVVLRVTGEGGTALASARTVVNTEGFATQGDEQSCERDANGFSIIVDEEGQFIHCTADSLPEVDQEGVTEVIPTFADVPSDYWAYDYIERLYAAGITSGCGLNPLRYCPEDSVTRAQMAIFLERGLHGSSFTPPIVASNTGFSDVPTNHWAGAWIKQLAADGITVGCGSGNYCPESPVTRAQMAVFLLRSKHGASYNPPAVGTSTGFGDVPATHWAGAWIKQLVTEGITAGCGSGNYCPESPVTRAQMAVFLVRTFSLP